MRKGDRSRNTERQKRHAQPIEKEDEERDIPGLDAEQRAWAAVYEVYGRGGGPRGAGHGKRAYRGSTRKGGRP